MATEKHISLWELQNAIGCTLNEAFPMPIWITAEIAELRTNQSGHCYIELIEKEYTSGQNSDFIGNSIPKAQARAVIWRGVWASLGPYFRGVTGLELIAGMKVLVKVMVSYHELYGFSLQITDIDPSYTLGEARRQRQQTISRLQADGIWDMNRQSELPAVIQRIAVVSSANAAGWRDFRRELDRFPFRFETELFEAVMQGVATEETVVAALEQIAIRTDEFDVVVIIRGGGSQSDLSAFDGYRLASHVAQFPLPVLTGIGHDKDRSVVDMVAAVELKTPTAAAVWLGERLAIFVQRLNEFSEHVSAGAGAVLERQRLRVERVGRVVSIGAVEMTRRLEVRLERLSGELVRRSGELFLRENLRLGRLKAVARECPGLFLARQNERLADSERAIALRRPENILSLGFAIVRSDGHAVIDPASLSEGQVLDITLHKGTTKAKII